MTRATRYLNAIMDMKGAQPRDWRAQEDPYPTAQILPNGDVRIDTSPHCGIVLDMAFTLSLADWLIDTYGVEKEIVE